MYWSDKYNKWQVHTTIGSDSYFLYNEMTYNCPEDLTSNWVKANEGSVDGGKMECADCKVEPSLPECKICGCKKTLLSNYGNGWDGEWSLESQEYENRPVYSYEHSGVTGTLYLYSKSGQWLVHTNIGKGAYYILNKLDTKCPEDLSS